MRIQHILALLVFCSAGLAPAAEPSSTVSRAEFDRWMESISNWGRWGEDDELGTLNLVTPAKSKAAVALVQEGVSVSMALDLNTVQDALNQNPFRHSVATGKFSGHDVAGDDYGVQYHGFAHSHIDGLPHFAHKASSTTATASTPSSPPAPPSSASTTSRTASSAGRCWWTWRGSRKSISSNPAPPSR